MGVTLLGLCAAGVLAGYLMQREMLNARIDQTRAIVDMGAQHGAGLQEAGRCRRDDQGGAICRVRHARANTLTYDKGDGYLFGYRLWTASPIAGARSEAGRHQPHGRRDQRPQAGARTAATASRPTARCLLHYEYVQARRGKADPQDLLRRGGSRLEHVSSAPAPISTISTPS